MRSVEGSRMSMKFSSRTVIRTPSQGMGCSIRSLFTGFELSATLRVLRDVAPGRSWRGGQDRRGMGCQPHARAVDTPGYLPLARSSAELLDRVQDQVEPEHPGVEV